MSKDNGESAFPMYIPHSSEGPEQVNFGMTLRDWFAGQESECPEFSIETAEALAGYKCPNIDNRLAYAKWVAAWKAKWRYISADAMIAERNKS